MSAGAYVYPPGGAMGFQRLICLKYHSVLKWESQFQDNIIFETYQFIKSPSSTPGRDWHVRPLTFCKKFNSQQLLFEQFFDIIGNFGSLHPKNESIFLFQCNIIFETYQYIEPPSSTPGGGRAVRPMTFLYEIQFSTTFIWTILKWNFYSLVGE